TPITELGFTGVGVGAAMAGLRPIVEWMTFNFGLLALDQVVNNAAKMRYMSGGQFSMPLVIRGPNGPAEYLSSQHSQALQSYFAHVPGLKVVLPATPADAKGLMVSAIRDDNPVVFLEHKQLYFTKGEVPDGEYSIPLGKAEIKRPGKDLTIVCYSITVHTALKAAELLQKEGIEAEVLDLRCLMPLDREAVLASVAKTKRAMVLYEAPVHYGAGGEIVTLIQQELFRDLRAPVRRIGGLHTHIAYAPNLCAAAVPTAEQVVVAARDLVGYERKA
ncbi:MAG TPA: pyruvate dehydrogenase complex E1 component subunit beta, partial [Spirochaetia bacterium]|nr:pyruvate dehydrogenase complex E1 component subunit beta [Spirochaetia bacterium]